jgi:basic membrane protein A
MDGLRASGGVISSVGGDEIPTVDRFIAGYQAGAKKANSRITILNGYTRDFLIAKGSGVVFQVASACGLGALEAAGEQGVWGIGVDVDQSFLGSHILTSAAKRLDVAVYETVAAFRRGTFRTGGTAVFSLRNDGVGLGAISPKVPRSFLAELKRVRAQIVAGAIRIPTTVR